MAKRRQTPKASKEIIEKKLDADKIKSTTDTVTDKDVEAHIEDSKADSEFENFEQEEIEVKLQSRSKGPKVPESADFFNTKNNRDPANPHNNRLHLVRYAGRVTYWTKPQIIQMARRPDVILVTDNSATGSGFAKNSQNEEIRVRYLELPRYTELSIPNPTRCKGCS